MVYPNFRVLMRWNTSVHYALAVGHLADRIAGGGPLEVQPPDDDEPLLREQIKEIQTRLNELGYDSGPVDGIAGPQTRRAVRAFQRDQELPADGHPDQVLLEVLRNQQG